MPANEHDKRIGANVRMRRNAAGLTQEALAAHLEVTFQQLQKYEKGSNRIGSASLAKIAHVLGCPIETLFEGITFAPGSPRRGGSASIAVPVPTNPAEDLPSRFFSLPSSRDLAEAYIAISDGPDRTLVVRLAKRLSLIPGR